MTEDGLAGRIAVVTGAPGPVVQGLFAALVEECRGTVRVAGVLAEGHGLEGRSCSIGFMRNLADGEAFSVFQDLGPAATACHVDGAGAVAAGEAVRRTIAAGCDLVVLNKFGKLEAGGQGLRDAFCAAIEAGVPVLTSVSPKFEREWRDFAAPFFVTLPADAAAIRAWWAGVRPEPAGA